MGLRVGIVVVVFLVSTLGALAVLRATLSGRAQATRRLNRLADVPSTLDRGGVVAQHEGGAGVGGGSLTAPHTEGDAPPGAEGSAWQAWRRTMAPLARRLERFSPKREASSGGGSGRRVGLDLRLQRAGIRLKTSEFQAIRLLSTMAGGLLGYAFLGGVNGAVVGCPAGWVAPAVYLSRRGSTRLHALNGQIGDALVMISNSLKAGYSFLQAMELVAAEMAPPLSEAFALTLQEMNLGADTEEALQGMADRSGSEDLDMVITGVLIQRQVGGNLAEVLDNISITMRERVRIQGEIKALTAQGRISGLVIGVLPVALFLLLMLINPAYMMDMVQHPLGKFMLGLGVAGELIGAVFIRKIIQIEV